MVQKLCIFLQKLTSQGKNSLVLSLKEPKQYIFDDFFYSYNARKLWFNVFLLFHVRKHMTSSFYLKWTEFPRNCEFCSNCGSPGTRTKSKQIHNFLWIRSTLRKMVNFICFLALKWRNAWNLSFLSFFE